MFGGDLKDIELSFMKTFIFHIQKKYVVGTYLLQWTYVTERH